MHNIGVRQLRPNGPSGSGRVRRFKLPNDKIRITQISTFCPEIIGPGSAHIYLIETDALLLVDTGIPTFLVKEIFFKWRQQNLPSGLASLPDNHSSQEIVQGLRSVGVSIGDINGLIITHGHPDHFLNGRFILEEGSPHVFAHIFELPEITSPWGNIKKWIWNRRVMASFGMPPPVTIFDEIIEDLDPETLGLSLKVDKPILKQGAFKIDGSEIQGIEIGHFPGHSPGSIGLTIGSGESRVLVCGDVLLQPITPSPDDLLSYLRTLQDMKSLENINLVLPGHGNVFHDIKSRVDFLERHHKKRLKFTYQACGKPISVWEIASIPKYFDTYVDPNQFNPVAGLEVLAHIELLKLAEGLHRTDIKDGVHFFQNTGATFEDVYDRILELVNDRNISTIMKY